MEKFFEQDPLVDVIRRQLAKFGYFVICYKLPKRINDAAPISFTGSMPRCYITQVSTREEAIHNLLACGLDPGQFDLSQPYFYRARILAEREVQKTEAQVKRSLGLQRQQ